MFSWPVNRVKPKMKATYTRKKPQSPLNPADRVNRTSAHVEALSDQENDCVADDDTGHDSMDVAPRSHIGSGIPSEDNSRMLGEDTSVALNNSALVANVVNTQLQQESANTDEEMSDEENELYEVEYFMADDYKMFPGSNIPQKALLTKWTGYELVNELTWEQESEMREDVLHIVEGYYKQKVSKSSNTHSQGIINPSNGNPNKVTKARGRPRKDNTAPRGRGRPRKGADPQQALPVKTSQGRRGRPPKVRQSETEER